MIEKLHEEILHSVGAYRVYLVLQNLTDNFTFDEYNSKRIIQINSANITNVDVVTYNNINSTQYQINPSNLNYRYFSKAYVVEEQQYWIVKDQDAIKIYNFDPLNSSSTYFSTRYYNEEPIITVTADDIVIP